MAPTNQAQPSAVEAVRYHSILTGGHVLLILSGFSRVVWSSPLNRPFFWSVKNADRVAGRLQRSRCDQSLGMYSMTRGSKFNVAKAGKSWPRQSRSRRRLALRMQKLAPSARRLILQFIWHAVHRFHFCQKFGREIRRFIVVVPYPQEGCPMN
jgi:hypothetical protein